MAIRDTGSEQLIKDTAKQLFFAEGKLDSTTQEIADKAGVNRTLINYYFRSKDILLEKVFRDAMQDMSVTLDKILSSELPFKEKIEKFIDMFYTEQSIYPYKEIFIINEINSNDYNLPKKDKFLILTNFLKEIEMQMDIGTVKKMKPINFMINIFSLISYPLVAQPLFKLVFDLNEYDYNDLLSERKKIIVDILFV